MYIEKHARDGSPRARRQEDREELPAPHDLLIGQHSEDVFLSWRAPEFEKFERDRKWYFIVALILVAIVSYAIWTNSPVMAITFILIGVVGYVYIEKEPRELYFALTPDGVIAGREIYEFDNLASFWIFYEPGDIKVISLKTKSHLAPYVHIPIHDQDPVAIREILLGYIEEEKHEPGLMEVMGRLLRL
jgi:hypothetical protein